MAPKDNGPKAKFSQLLPYLFEHKAALWIAMALSVVGAAISWAALVCPNKHALVQIAADSQNFRLMRTRPPFQLKDIYWHIVPIV